MTDPEGSEDEPQIGRSQIVVGGKSSTLDPRKKDAISPKAIHHHVDELRDSGVLKERYNYYVYLFERDGSSCQARAYIDTIQEVALLGNPTGRQRNPRVPLSAFRDDVLEYLKQRFSHIIELGEEGYETLWRRTD